MLARDKLIDSGDNMMKKIFSKDWVPAMMLVTLMLLSSGCLQGGGKASVAQEEPVGSDPIGSQGADLQAILSAPDQVSLCDPIPIVFTVTNQSDRTLYLLKWYTPLEGIAGKIIQVARDGQELDYLGILAMRGDPTRDQYVTLEPGASASAEFDISEYFDFGQPGEYQVTFQSPWISYLSANPEDLVLSVDDLGPVEIPSAPVTVTVLPGNGSEDCAQRPGEGSLPGDSLPVMTLSGTVQDASPSAGIIQLAEAVSGVSTIALTADTALVDQNGVSLALNEVFQGMELEAAGLAGEVGTLIADRVVISR
jgi:hypothetical protein